MIDEGSSVWAEGDEGSPLLTLSANKEGFVRRAMRKGRLRVLTQSPEPRTHRVRYFGAYSSKAQAFRKKANLTLESLGGPPSEKAGRSSSSGSIKPTLLSSPCISATFTNAQ